MEGKFDIKASHIPLNHALEGSGQVDSSNGTLENINRLMPWRNRSLLQVKGLQY